MQPQLPPQFAPVGEGSQFLPRLLNCVAFKTWLKRVAPKLTEDDIAKLNGADLDEDVFNTHETIEKLQGELERAGIRQGSARLIAVAHFAKRGMYYLLDTSTAICSIFCSFLVMSTLLLFGTARTARVARLP